MPITGHMTMNQLAVIESAPAEATARLVSWAHAARDALAENTQRAYRVDSQAFATWCRAQGVIGLPASPATVAAFLRDESAAGKSVATIRRRASTISRVHKAAGLANPCADELVRLALKGIARNRGTDQRQAAPLTERDAVTIRAHMGNCLKDARDLALVLVGRDLLARSGELVGLQAEVVEFNANGALLNLRRAKTSTDSHAYYLGREAATALQGYLSRAGITSGPAFQSMTKGGNVTGQALSTRDVRRILKSCAVRARLSHASTVSGHSVRVGMAQDLIAADLDIASVMQAGGWTTPRMVARYTERQSASRGAVARYYGRRA
jgi:site-specific recombinase XerD